MEEGDNFSVVRKIYFLGLCLGHHTCSNVASVYPMQERAVSARVIGERLFLYWLVLKKELQCIEPAVRAKTPKWPAVASTKEEVKAIMDHGGGPSPCRHFAV